MTIVISIKCCLCFQFILLLWCTLYNDAFQAIVTTILCYTSSVLSGHVRTVQKVTYARICVQTGTCRYFLACLYVFSLTYHLSILLLYCHGIIFHDQMLRSKTISFGIYDKIWEFGSIFAPPTKSTRFFSKAQQTNKKKKKSTNSLSLSLFIRSFSPFLHEHIWQKKQQTKLFLLKCRNQKDSIELP